VPAVQNAAYQLIQDRCCGEISFSDNIFIIAAGNRLGDGGNSYSLPPALANRFNHLELLAPTLDKWVDWAIENEVDSRIIAFLQFRQSFLMDDMNDVRKTRAMAWASPRSWVKASNKIAPYRGKENINVLYRKVGSAVGKAKSIEFQAFVKTTKKINLEHILDNPVQVSDLELSMKWALITTIAEYYRGEKKRLNDILAVCKYLDPDFSVSMLRMMRRFDKDKSGNTKFSARLGKCSNKDVILGFMKYFQD